MRPGIASSVARSSLALSLGFGVTLRRKRAVFVASYRGAGSSKRARLSRRYDGEEEVEGEVKGEVEGEVEVFRGRESFVDLLGGSILVDAVEDEDEDKVETERLDLPRRIAALPPMPGVEDLWEPWALIARAFAGRIERKE